MRLGVKASWKDADIMAKIGLDLMEIFIGEKDLYEHEQKMVDTFSRISRDYGIELVIHTQEYWVDGKEYRLVDLASMDDFLRRSAVKIVKKTLDFANRIEASYVIVHPGGIAPEKIEREKPLTLIKKSMKEFRDERLIVENMPWFYIMHNGSIWRSNICIEPKDFLRFSDSIGGVTFDICHAYLSDKKGGNHHIENMKKGLGKIIKHVHASDAKPPHHEGLQIGQGFVDFNLLKDIKVGIVPEIIDGHKNQGEGFRIAINKLKKYV